MNVTGLFAGIGGFELGLKTLGHHATDLVEIDPKSRAVLARHFPSARLHSDVQAFRPQTSGGILCGGFPCQDISSANVCGRPGLDGPKSSLWHHFARIVGEQQPHIVLVENVSGGRDWVPRVRGDLAALGYTSFPGLRMRADRMGYHHGRRRVFVVAYSDSQGKPSRSLHEALACVRQDASLTRHRRLPPSEFVGEDDGVPHRMVRCRQLGNAVMPEMAENLARLISYLWP